MSLMLKDEKCSFEEEVDLVVESIIGHFIKEYGDQEGAPTVKEYPKTSEYDVVVLLPYLPN